MAKNLSANTLFHFTSKTDNLFKIINEGFKPNYCLETWPGMENQRNEIAFPMVCFCDIPLSSITEHASKYGKYALGVSKDWGVKNAITPIIYTHINSITERFQATLHNNLISLFNIDTKLPEYADFKKHNDIVQQLTLAVPNIFERDPDKKKAHHILSDTYSMFAHFIRHMKPYEGSLYRKGNGYLENVRFYDEREWRFVPQTMDLAGLGIKDSYKAETFKREGFYRWHSKLITQMPTLRITPKDIRFIIVDKEKEISGFIDKLDEHFVRIFQLADLKLLYSKIISLEQILEDF